MFIIHRLKKITMTTAALTSLLFVSQVDGKNIARGGSANSPTAEDQLKGSRHDVELTRRVREALTRREGFSTQAQNIQIITINGVMTLRGPVQTTGEKQQIEDIAKAVAPDIRNELEVTK